MLSTRNPLQTSRHIQTESERIENIFHANGKQKKAGVAILISDKIDLKIKKITRDKKGHYIIDQVINDQAINPRGRHNNCKHLCTQHTAKSLQSCLTLCDPKDGSPPGSPIPGIL